MKNNEISIVEITTSENYTFKCRVGGIYVKDKVIILLHGFPETSMNVGKIYKFLFQKDFM